MNRTPDVIVVGAGLAGLCAALFAARRGKTVQVLAYGAGALSIGSGCIDLLGYLPQKGTSPRQPVTGEVLEALEQLPETHPYALVGTDCVRQSLAALNELCSERSFPLACSAQGNHWLPTIMGTLKPSYLCPPASDPVPLYAGRRILVVGIAGIKDCRPALIVQQLRRYPSLADKEFREAMLPAPFGDTHRNISPLDVARYLDTAKGRDWFIQSLTPHVRDMDAMLLPPICGTTPSKEVWTEIRQRTNCAPVEMLSIPPGVGGMRLRALLLDALRAHGVSVMENTMVTRAVVEDKRCLALVTEGEDVARTYPAGNFILGTGGILGGGIATTPGKAVEPIFGLSVDAPADPAAWSSPEIFDSHIFSSLGLRVNKRLAPVDAEGNEFFENVHVVGRSLGGYDLATEKCGNGVALATAWHAAQQV